MKPGPNPDGHWVCEAGIDVLIQVAAVHMDAL